MGYNKESVDIVRAYWFKRFNGVNTNLGNMKTAKLKVETILKEHGFKCVYLEEDCIEFLRGGR